MGERQPSRPIPPTNPKGLDLTAAMLLVLLIPVFAISLGVAFLGERMAPGVWAGFALIALGFAVTDGRLFRRGQA